MMGGGPQGPAAMQTSQGGLTHVSIPLGGAQAQLPPPPALPAMPQQAQQPKAPGLLNEASLAALGGIGQTAMHAASSHFFTDTAALASLGGMGQPPTNPPQPFMGQQHYNQQASAMRQPGFQVPQELQAGNQFKSASLALFKALKMADVTELKTALNQRADVNELEDGHRMMSPLHCALECGGSVDAVNLLLKSRALVNAAMVGGETPLHIAMQRYMDVPPLVIRMLFCHQADLAVKNIQGITPLDRVREISSQAHSASREARLRLREISNEITEMPTIDVLSIEGSGVRSAHFADMRNQKIVFKTDSSIGTYSLTKKRLTFMKKLKQQKGSSSVEYLSANPALGTLAVCLVIVEQQPNGTPKYQNVFIIWPNGKLQDEEPLKLSVTLDPQPAPGALPACVILSRTDGPQLLLSRLLNGKVLSWRLNQQRTQLMVETQLVGNAGIIAASDDGCWIAMIQHQDGKSILHVHSYESPAGLRHEPVQVWTCEASPVCMAIQQAPRPASAGASGRLAIVAAAVEGQSPPPIEVWDICVDGNGRMMYRLNVPSPCSSLNFCYGAEDRIFSGHTDGLAVLYDLPKGSTSQCQGSPDSFSLSMSTDHKLVVATESDCFRIFKLPADPGAV